MGVLDDIGVLEKGVLSTSAFSGFVNDVKKRLTTGKGIFKSPTIGKQADPIENFNLAKIEDALLFPDFHRVWKDRYTKTVQQLNIPGSFQSVPKIPAAPIIDPTALAKKLGAPSPPPAKFPDVLFEIQGSPPPSGGNPPPTILHVISGDLINTTIFFDKYLKGLDPLDPKIIAKLISVLNAAPAKISPKQPNPLTKKHGYTEQHLFEEAVYAAQRNAHDELMIRAADPAFLPSLIVQMASGQNEILLTEVYAIVAKHQPAQMATSVFELAAQEVLMQHQVKLQCIALLGQNIGSGEVIKALAATPEEQGGLGLLNMSKSKSDQIPGDEKPAYASDTNAGSTGSSPTLSGGGSQATTTGDQNPFMQGQSAQDEMPPGPTPTNEMTYGGGNIIGGDTPSDEYPPAASASPDAPSQQPSGFGFGGQPDESPPDGGQVGSSNQNAQNSGVSSTQQQSPFGLEPPDEVQPSGVQGGGGNSQSNVSPWASPPADDYPAQGNQGQTSPPGAGGGWGGAPTDEGSISQEPVKLPQEAPEGGETMAAGNPSDPYTEPEVELEPVPTISSDKMQLAPEGTDAANRSSNDDDDYPSPGGSKSSKSGLKPSGKVRERIKDLIEGGPTCEGCLGPLPDWRALGAPTPKNQINFAGYQGGPTSDKWSKPLKGAPGARNIIGSGFTDKATIQALLDGGKTSTNPVQAVPTSCGNLSSWIFNNLVGTGDKPIKFNVSNAQDNVKSTNAGFAQGSNSYGAGGNVKIGTLGFDFVYTGAALGAWMSMFNQENLVNRTPKYGDVYLTCEAFGTGGGKTIGTVRHTGVIVEWHPEEGWFGTADAGAGNMGSNVPGATAEGATQGMAYTIRKLLLDTEGRSYIVSPEGHQAKSVVYLAGFIHMDIFVKNLKDHGSKIWGDENKDLPAWIT